MGQAGLMKTLVILGHPDKESYCGALAQAYMRGAEESGAQVRLLALGDLEFDESLRKGFKQPQAHEPDLELAKEAILWADHIVWIFPLWWANVPAVLKGFIDRVLLPRWAFEYEPGRSLPKGLLAPRTSEVIVTMDSPTWWYRFWLGHSINRVFSRGTLRFVGMKVLKETYITGLEHREDAWKTQRLEAIYQSAKRLTAKRLSR